MEFDKSRVYTAVNAEELEIGSLIIAALNLEELDRKVKSEMDIQHLAGIADSSNLCRFGLDIYDDLNNLRYYPLAYLIEPPAEPKYKPFDSVKKAMEAIKAHGGWVKCGGSGREFLVTGCGTNKEDYAVYITSDWISLEELFKDYVFVNDGSPCGELVEQ